MYDKEGHVGLFLYGNYGRAFLTVRGTPSHPRNVQRQLGSALKKAELPHFGLHDLRRTCLTNLANRGFPMHKLGAYAGHSKSPPLPNTTWA